VAIDSALLNAQPTLDAKAQELRATAAELLQNARLQRVLIPNHLFQIGIVGRKVLQSPDHINRQHNPKKAIVAEPSMN
jgi:hypothetical protein